MGARILLLEDDTFCRGLLETVLISEGYDIVHAESPEHLIEIAGANPHAVALVDFWGRSQLSLSEEDRAQLVRLTARVPTILVSARRWAEDCTAAELGLLAIIPKPFDIQVLYEAVASCVKRVQAYGSSTEESSAPGMCA